MELWPEVTSLYGPCLCYTNHLIPTLFPLPATAVSKDLRKETASKSGQSEVKDKLCPPLSRASFSVELGSELRLTKVEDGLVSMEPRLSAADMA